MGQQISARGDPVVAGEPLEYPLSAAHPKGMTETRIERAGFRHNPARPYH